MSLSNRNNNTKTDYASIEGGYQGSPRPPQRTDSVMDKLHQLPQRYFSPRASRQQICAYILSACLFLSTTCIVLFEPWLRPPCDEALVDAIFPKHDAPFVNPHYDPGCRNVRYIQLLNLTQRASATWEGEYCLRSCAAAPSVTKGEEATGPRAFGPWRWLLLVPASSRSRPS